MDNKACQMRTVLLEYRYLSYKNSLNWMAQLDFSITDMIYERMVEFILSVEVVEIT